MKAIVINGYGGLDLLQLTEVDQPQLADDGILVRVQAAGVNAGDLFTVRGSPWLVRFTTGFPRPKNHVLGWDVAGRVEAVGSQVTLFRPGDEVFGGAERAFAEYVSADADAFAKKPANLSFVEAAALPTAATTALQALRDHGNVREGDRVLINGASGGVGSFAVQIAKALGAEVTAVCSTTKVNFVRSLGADYVVDYTTEDVTRSGGRYDLILDNSASQTFFALKRVLEPKGLILPNSGHGGMSYVFKAFFLSAISRRHGRPFMAVPNHEDLNTLKAYCESGKVRPVIDKAFPLMEAAQALRHLERRKALGKVVITMSE